jgi:hypothetical protein
MLHRQAIFFHAYRGEPFFRNTAHANVRTRLAAAGLDPEAGHGTQRIGDTERRIHTQRLAADGRDRVTHLDFANLFDTGATGDDHLFDIVRARILGMRKPGGEQRQGDSELTANGVTKQRHIYIPWRPGCGNYTRACW